MVVKVALNLQLWQNTSSQRVACNSLVTVAKLFSQKTYLATFLAFLRQTMQPRNSEQMCKIKETTHLTRNADLYAS